jgi:hypothetical protein
MDTKQFVGLMEAYSEVYAPQEEIEEGLRSAVKRLLGRGENDAEAPKPMSRGEVLRQRYNVGPEKSDTSAKRQILNRSRARAERDEDKYGGSVYTKKVADKSKEAHDRYLKAGYSKYGADLKHGRGNKAAKRVAALKNEDLDIFDVVLEFLQTEGYAETLEEAEWMMANMIDEEAIDIILGEEQLDEISQKTATRAYALSRSGEFEGADSDRDLKRTDNLEKHIKRKFGDKAVQDADRHADSTTFGRKDPRTGKRQPSPKPRIEKNRTYRTTKAGKMHGQDQSKLKRDLEYKRSSRNEEFVGEAQVANRDPEKYEREQAKKSAPVRGERTPMPPRGDKRREDFEKWYAKQMGR